MAERMAARLRRLAVTVGALGIVACADGSTGGIALTDGGTRDVGPQLDAAGGGGVQPPPGGTQADAGGGVTADAHVSPPDAMVLADAGEACTDGTNRSCNFDGCAADPDRKGNQTCMGGAWGPCGTPDVCNGVDDDCDGQTDEDVAGLGAACSVGIGACAASGHTVCGADGQPICDATEGAPAAEICGDNQDNDCDGTVDNGCGCQIDTDCPVDQRCVNGACEAAPPVGCQVDADCPVGQGCTAGNCVDLPPGVCRNDVDCPAGEVCINGACEANQQGCVRDADCPAGESCLNGDCVAPPPECAVDADCRPGETCVAGACIAAPAGCQVDLDCGLGEICDAGDCVLAPGGCHGDADCLADETCQDGFCAPPVQACVPDVHEEDDLVGNAVAIAVPAQLDLNHCDDGVDWMSFDANPAAAYDLQTSNLGTAEDTILELYGTDGQTLITSNDDLSPGDLASRIAAWTPPAAGTYFVAVRTFRAAFGADRGYTLSVSEACLDDAFEEDDASDRAANFVVGGGVQLHRHCDPDWVSFDATAGTAYVLETRDLQGVADTILEVYDTDGTTVLTSNDDYNGTLASHVEWTAPANGTYFARVGSFGDQYGGERSYSLDVRLAAQAQCVADADCAPGEICDQGACVPNPVRCAPDANEEDDDVASARVLTVDRQFAGLSFCDDATDFISFDATAGQVYDAQTFNLSPGADTILELYDADGVTLLASNDDDGVGGGLASLIQGWTAPATATYYVLVRSYGDAFGPDRNYSVGVRESCVDDAFENDDNASIAHAVAVDAPAEAHKHCQDEDWIGFQATAGTNYVLETSALVGADDTLIGLYDGTGALLASDDDGNGNLASRLAWQAPADGTYYLRIGAWSEIYGGARGYSVRVSTGVSCNLNANCPAGQVCVAGLCGPAPVGCAVDADCGAGFTCVNTVCVATPRCQADANEEDDAVAQAHPLTVGRPLTLNHCDDALDAFSFDATAGQLFDFQTSGLGASADTIIHVIGTDGVTELTSDDDGGGGRASLVTGWVAPADGTYYVTVTSFQNAFGDAREYTFIARETCTDDAYEEDDTAADGRLVALGTPQDHAFCADADWLRFNGVAGRAVRIETSNLVGGADTIVDVYDVDGVTMLDSNDDGAGNLASLLVFTPAANGVYGVRVHSYGDLYGGARAYTVSITDNAGGCTVDADCAAGEICQGAACIPAPPRCAADGNEEDDTSADAKLLGVGHDVRLNFCDDGGDWLAFDAVAGESYDIVTFNLDAVGRTDTILELVDTDGATVLRRDDDGAGDGLASLIAAWSAPAAGRYYVHVVSFLGRSGNDIAYSVGIRSACTDDLYEQDDRSATAGNFTPGDPIQDRKLCEDEDWVQFGALAGHGYRIETLNLLGGADTLIALFDTNGVQLGSDDDANGNLASRLDWRAPADGNYFVQIANFGAVYGGQRAYQFRITEIAAAGICAADADCGAGQLCVSGQCVRGPNGCAVDADCPAGLSCVNGQCAAVAHCVPDSNEEDDALAQAHFLAVGHAIALNFCDDATDWLAVDLVAGQSYDLYTGGLEGATDTIITLFDAAQTQLATNDDADASGRRDSLIAGFVAPATATYYLAVSSYRGAAGDALSYTVGVVESCNDDVFEDDDTTVESHAFAVGAGAEAHALCRDNDFVSLAATAGRTYTIVTGNLAVGTDTILEVYDVDGVTVLQSNDDVGGALNSGLRFVAPATATYFVRVLSFGENYGGTRAYALNIVAGNGCLVDADCGAGNTCNVGVCGAVLNCNPDTFEEDDTFQAANVTGIGASGDHNFCEDANDWLSFAAVAGQAYDFQTYNLGDQTDTILELYDADGVTQLLSDDDGAADGTASLISNWTAPANATYYVRVGSYQNDQGASHEYTVNVHNHCVDDAFEHDNNPNQAHVFGNGVFGVAETHALCANEDWLRFDTVAGAVYTIQTSNLQGGADTTLYLVDTDGVTALLYDDDGAGGRASLIANWTAPTTGTYFVRVGNYDEIYGGPRTYDVNITRR